MHMHHVKRAALMAMAFFAATIASAATLSTFTIGPTVSGINTTATITLTGPAGPHYKVSLTSSDQSLLGVPDHVDFHNGDTTKTFPVHVGIVNADTSGSIVATDGVTTLTVTPTVSAATLGGFTMNPTTLLGGQNGKGTVTFVGKPGTGSSVTLSSSDPSVVVPATVNVNKGQNHVDFNFTTTPVDSTTTANVSATYGAITETVAVTVNAADLKDFHMDHNVDSGGTVNGDLKLNGLAGPSGTTITLAASDANLTVPASVLVPAGTDHVSFTGTAAIVNTPDAVTVTATGNVVSLTQTVNIRPGGLDKLNIGPHSVLGGNSLQGDVSIHGHAPSPAGATITLASSDPSATVPGSVVIPAGQNHVHFTITTTGVSADTPVTITATYNSASVTDGFTVRAAVLQDAHVAPDNVTGGTATTFTVRLNGIAPPGGASVTLTSSNPAVASMPGTVTVAGGATTASVPVTTFAVLTNTNVTLSATYNSVTKSDVLHVRH